MMTFGDNKYRRPIGAVFDVGEERRTTGQITLKRGDLFDSNVVSIADDKFVRIDHGESLHGVSEAGRVSLLDCIGGGTLSCTRLGNQKVMYHGDVAFRYALFGREYLSAEQSCIRGIQFTLEGVESSVFWGNSAFETIISPDKEILDVIRRKRPEYLKGDFVEKKAYVSYFTGKFDVLPRCETALGVVRVGRSIGFNGYGFNVQKTPSISITFNEPQTLEGAWDKMRELRQFFSWMMGYTPAWKDVRVFTSELDKDGFLKAPDSFLDVFGSNEWREVPEGARRSGTLIDALCSPSHFIEVMRNWLVRNTDPNRKRANVRFWACLPGAGNRFLEDRIVSAANTFDLLPTEDKPETPPLESNLDGVLNEARKKIKAMPDGAQRDDILNALGRIRANRRLRDVVEYRAEVVLAHFGEEALKQFKEVIRLAVQCRNYYTHGGYGQQSISVDFSDLGLVCFLAETLEFIYGTSELLCCGWDPTTSARDERHPLGGYVPFYERNRSIVNDIRPDTIA